MFEAALALTESVMCAYRLNPIFGLVRSAELLTS